MTTNITLRFLSPVVGERRAQWSTSELNFVFFTPFRRVSKATSRQWFMQYVNVESSGKTQAKSRTTPCPPCHFHRQFEAFVSRRKAMMQVQALRDQRPQYSIYSYPPTHPVCLYASTTVPSPLVLRSHLFAIVRRPTSGFEKSVDIVGWTNVFGMNRQENLLRVQSCC